VRDSRQDLDPDEHDEPLPAADLETWDSEAEVSCPHCGEPVTIAIDPAGGAVQTYVEDCQVCCRPWQVHVSYDDHGAADVWVEPS
jgi:hypothetical protein